MDVFVTLVLMSNNLNIFSLAFSISIFIMLMLEWLQHFSQPTGMSLMLEKFPDIGNYKAEPRTVKLELSNQNKM